MTDTKAFVLLSGGLDSSTCLWYAAKRFNYCEAVSIDYGQRHKKEIDAAHKICGVLGCTHTTLPIGNLLSGSMLTDRDKAIPAKRYDELKGVSPTYVPFRNGLMLSVLTAYAQKWVNARPDVLTAMRHDESPAKREAVLFFGAHAEDAKDWAYPDCTPEFIGAMANAIFIGSYQSIRLIAPVQNMMKHEIVRMAVDLGVPLDMTWSCYKGEELHCGDCPTCYARKEAFERAGVADPTVYAAP